MKVMNFAAFVTAAMCPCWLNAIRRGSPRRHWRSQEGQPDAAAGERPGAVPPERGTSGHVELRVGETRKKCKRDAWRPDRRKA